MDSLCGEPVCLWLPEAFLAPGTSKDVQSVEVGPLPEAFDVITLPEGAFSMDALQKPPLCLGLPAHV